MHIEYMYQWLYLTCKRLALLGFKMEQQEETHGLADLLGQCKEAAVHGKAIQSQVNPHNLLRQRQKTNNGVRRLEISYCRKTVYSCIALCTLLKNRGCTNGISIQATGRGRSLFTAVPIGFNDVHLCLILEN